MESGGLGKESQETGHCKEARAVRDKPRIITGRRRETQFERAFETAGRALCHSVPAKQREMHSEIFFSRGLLSWLVVSSPSSRVLTTEVTWIGYQ